MTEMRILLPRILCNFQINIPVGSELTNVKPVAGDPVYDSWSRSIGGPCQPHSMKLQFTPLNTPFKRSKASKL
jgi:hypothetical protein